MPRKRMINPSIWTDIKFNKLSIPQRLLFIGLISNADDEGRLRGEPEYLKMIIFPTDKIPYTEISAMIKAIGDMIISYNIDGRQCIQLANWNKHQYINRPTPSLLPAPHGYISEQSVSNHGAITENSLPSQVKSSQSNLMEYKRSQDSKTDDTLYKTCLNKVIEKLKGTSTLDDIPSLLCHYKRIYDYCIRNQSDCINDALVISKKVKEAKQVRNDKAYLTASIKNFMREQSELHHNRIKHQPSKGINEILNRK
jgi:hypothetical protein